MQTETAALELQVTTLPPPDLGLNIPSMESDVEEFMAATDSEHMSTCSADGQRDPTEHVSDFQKADGNLGELCGDENSGELCAITRQFQRQVDHDIGQLLPRMHGLSNTIGDMMDLNLTEDVLEFQGLIEMIGSQLEQLLKEVGHEDPPDMAAIGANLFFTSY